MLSAVRIAHLKRKLPIANRASPLPRHLPGLSSRRQLLCDAKHARDARVCRRVEDHWKTANRDRRATVICSANYPKNRPSSQKHTFYHVIIHRLQKEVVEPRFHWYGRMTFRVPTRKPDDERLGVLRSHPQFSYECVAAQVGQANVRNHRIESAARRQLQRLRPEPAMCTSQPLPTSSA